jgi:hypothetical protein
MIYLLLELTMADGSTAITVTKIDMMVLVASSRIARTGSTDLRPG